jgi:hypothetical protein
VAEVAPARAQPPRIFLLMQYFLPLSNLRPGGQINETLCSIGEPSTVLSLTFAFSKSFGRNVSCLYYYGMFAPVALQGLPSVFR